MIGEDDIKFHNNCFYNKYNDFVHIINKKHKISLRDIDKAFMVFGQFLLRPQKFFELNYCNQKKLKICQKSKVQNFINEEYLF